jgi:hypothetical protein
VSSPSKCTKALTSESGTELLLKALLLRLVAPRRSKRHGREGEGREEGWRARERARERERERKT